jgi:transposase
MFDFFRTPGNRMLKVDQVHAIRHQVLVQGRSVRQVAREMRVSRNTVRRYVGVPEPARAEGEPRPRPVLEKVAPRLEELFEEWSVRTTPKQRLTAMRLHRQLRQEGLVVGATLVKEWMHERRRQRMEAFVPLVHRPGEEAQVDFFSVVAEIAGEREDGWLFLMRLMYSGRDFAWLYPRCDQVSFLDGHVRAFAHFEGVPARGVYDNLSAAVRKVVMPHRELTDRFRALANHYAFEPCFARVGEGHDKGGVESRGNATRLQHLTPVPQAPSWEEASRELLAKLDGDLERRRDGTQQSVRELFEQERGVLRPLAGQPFDARRVVPVSVPRRTVVRVEGAWYSVPSRWKCLQATAHVGPEQVTVSCRGESVTRPRQRFGERCVRYRDFLPELATKPQALRQVAAELLAELGAPFDRLWALLVQSHGAREAARVLSRVVGAIHDHGEEPVRQAVLTALQAERTDLLALAVLLARPCPQRVEVPAALAHHEVEAARAADYDVLLGGGWA